MTKRYDDCIGAGGDCAACSLSRYGRDCRGAPAGQIAYLRKRAGLTQAQLGEASGLDGRAIRKYESGESSPSKMTLATAVAMAKALGVAPEDLLP